MSSLVANARMYAVTPAVEDAWRQLLQHVVREAGLAMAYLPYPAPQPLEELWAREDVGCVFMCGFPIALRLSEVTPVASPIPALDWAGGKAVYRSDLIVRADAGINSLEESFGKRAGWTVEHSHSGFNAFRYHLLAHRSAQRPSLYGEVRGGLVTARRILDEINAGAIDIGPLDAFWHHLLRRERPELFANIKVIGSTALAPMPAFVAGKHVSAAAIDDLRFAFVSASKASWFKPLGDRLAITGFAPVTHATFEPTLERHHAALDAGYPLPA